MNRCSRCIMPDTKPDLTFDKQGVCSACRAYEARPEVDWDARRAELTTILDAHRNPNGHDCIIPVSGGKDSTFQALTIRDMGYNPLLVTATTCEPSDLGRRNLANLISLGFDHVQVTVRPDIRARINRHALVTIGDISWPEHVTIFTIPVRMSVAFDIPLIIWGENSQHEYGGPAASQDSPTLTRAWLDEFGGLCGMRVGDVRDALGLTAADMALYTYPSDEELARVGTTGLFLGHYVPWDGEANAAMVRRHGFEFFDRNVEGSLCPYENLDNHQTGIHDYFKWLKFGFGRACDIACSRIRRGRMTRDAALDAISGVDGAYPATCLGRPLSETLARIGMTCDEFGVVCERWKR